MTKLIDRSLGYPAHASVVTCTVTDFQTAARFDVYEGDAAIPEENRFLGTVSCVCPYSTDCPYIYWFPALSA
jgi:molecular chaperone DnaK (HSP70)